MTIVPYRLTDYGRSKSTLLHCPDFGETLKENWKMTDSLKKKTFTGVIWNASERFGTQALQFVVGIILARLLVPADFGIIGMLTIFIVLSQTFIDSGFSIALIRKNDASNIDFSTVFWFNVIVAFLVYCILFIVSPYIAIFYNQPILVILTRVITIILLINSFGEIQRTILTKKIDFKSQAKVRLFSILVGSFVGIFMALKGYGVWSLVGKTLTQTALTNLGYWIMNSWRPQFIFSSKSFKELFSFSSKLLFSGLLSMITMNIYTLIVGKLFNAQSLGYYTRAKQFNDFPVQTIQGVSMSVLYPVLSQIQDDTQRLKEGYKKFLRMITFVLLPIMALLIIIAEPLIRIILTEKWMPVVPLLQIYCIIGAMIPLQSINVNILIVKGRSDFVLLLDIFKIILLFVIVFIFHRWGIIGLMWGLVILSFIGYFLNVHYANKLMEYGIIEQLSDIKVYFFTTIIMSVVVLGLKNFINGDFLILITSIFVGTLVYVIANIINNTNELIEIKNYFKQFISNYQK